MTAKTLRAIVAGAVGVLVLSACLKTTTSNAQVITAPDPVATGFGSTFSMDEGRLVARAEVDGTPVVYVFDAAGSGWVHSATIAAPSTASGFWGESLAVSGDVIAVADPWIPTSHPLVYGKVTLYERTDGQWTVRQNILSDQGWDNFAAGVWLSGDGLVVSSGRACDEDCILGQWTLYHRYGTYFSEVFRTDPGVGLSVGVDDGRFALGNPGDFDIDAFETDNALRVIDTNVTLPTFLLDEFVPYQEDWSDPTTTTQLFRKVDLSGDVLAYESCCTSDDRLHLRRFDGTTYQPEATFPLTMQSESVVVLPDVVLVADADAGVWHAYAHHEGKWKRSSDLPAPDAVAAQFAVPPVAVGDKIAVQGDGVIHVLTIDVVKVDDD